MGSLVWNLEHEGQSNDRTVLSFRSCPVARRTSSRRRRRLYLSIGDLFTPVSIQGPPADDHLRSRTGHLRPDLFRGNARSDQCETCNLDTVACGHSRIQREPADEQFELYLDNRWAECDGPLE